MTNDTRFARTRKALALVSLGAIAWIGGGLYYGFSVLDGFMVGLLLIALGFALAAWRMHEAPRLAALGFALSFVGILLFLGPNLGRLDRLAPAGSHVFALAMVIMAASMLFPARPQAALFRAGAAVVVIATLIWIAADVNDVAWQPGNVLAGAGSAWAIFDPDWRA